MHKDLWFQSRCGWGAWRVKNGWLNSALLPSLDGILPIHVVASARPEDVVRDYPQQQQHHSRLQASL